VSAVRDRLARDPLLATRGQTTPVAPQESVSTNEPAGRKDAVGRLVSARRRARKVKDERLAAIEQGSAEGTIDESLVPREREVYRPPVSTSETAGAAEATGSAATGESRAASRAADETPARIYSEHDSDVTPPEPRRPQKLTALHVAGRPDESVTIELVINARGRLDSARATTAPRSVGESLLLATGLHAVKSWEFRPALKDGFPVSYRKLMSLGAY
jgi:hypothetical protein